MRSKSEIYTRIRNILESARTNIARSVNSTQVIANWLVGREIVEEEQQGKLRAAYGTQLIAELSLQLQKEFGIGYSTNNLEYFRLFYITYPDLLNAGIPHVVRGE